MKTLLLIALLSLSSVAVKAQADYNNGTNCDVEFREVCVNMATCTVVSTSPTWTSLPALTPATPLPPTTCSGPGIVRAYEVRYAASTGCSSTSVTVLGPVSCPSIPNAVRLPSCPCNGVDGVMVHFSGLHLNIDL